MIIKKINAFLLIPALLFLITSCYSPKIVVNDGSGWIPEKFNPKSDILVIESCESKAQTKKMEKYMNEKYPYKFEFATLNEVVSKTGKFTDRKLYRYFLYMDATTATYQSGMMEKGGGTHSVLSALNDFYFVDKVSGKMYPMSKMAASYPYKSFKNVIDVILKKTT